MRNALVYSGALLICLSMLLSGLALKQRFDQGAKTRIAICRANNDIREILHDDHAKRLAQARAHLDDVLQFQRGRPIPKGFTQADVSRAVLVAHQDIEDETRILDETKSKSCR